MFIGLFVFALYLYFFVGLGQILVVLKGINTEQYLIFYSLAIVAVVFANFFWSAAWRASLSTLSIKISMKNAFLYYWSGYFVDLVVPCETVCGELTRLYLVYKETKNNYGSIASGGITNRILAYIIVVGGLYISAILLFFNTRTPAFVWGFLIFIIMGASVYLGILLYLALSEKAASTLASMGLRILRTFRPKKYVSKDLSPETRESLSAFYQGFRVFRENPRQIIKPFVFLTISFLVSLSAYVLVFFALGLQSQSFAFFIIVYFVAGSLTDATASFSVGTLDIILATIFILYGLPRAQSGITAALLRSVTFWFPLILGYVIVQVVGTKNLLAPRPKEAAEKAQVEK